MPDASKIRVLSDRVANKIAAGEVVDRPCSVVKELVENALDSGADTVDVEIAGGGRKLIAVTDNGAGMVRDDALLSVERHATSKIRDVDDIENIGTLGFRGEALAAISSVSRFKLQTCVKTGEPGTEITLSGGKMLDTVEAGVPAGTRVEVKDLFFNVPARRKFLRTQQTELSHVRQFFVVQALARPDVGMSLTVDGRKMYDLAAGATLEDRIRDIFGSNYLQDLRQVDFRKGEMSVEGYAGIPTMNRADRGELFLFVNSRATDVPVLSYAMKEAYGALIPARRHPIVFLFISTPPGQVDVNVHPTKKEVRFRKPSDVRDAVIEAIRAALSVDGDGSLGDLAAVSPADHAGSATGFVNQSRFAIPDLPAAPAFQYPGLRIDAAEDEQDRDSDADTTHSDGDGTNAPWAWCRVLGQVGGLYVLLEIEDGYVTMDPHAAHERVLFERFMDAVLEGDVESQGLLSPVTVEMLPADALLVRKNLDLLQRMGFGISEFGGDSFVVDALPSYFDEGVSQHLLLDVARSLERAGKRGGTETWKEEAIARAACRAAVRSQDRMNLEEIERLVVELANARMPYTCPHGRPTLIFTSFEELKRKFGRDYSM